MLDTGSEVFISPAIFKDLDQVDIFEENDTRRILHPDEIKHRKLQLAENKENKALHDLKRIGSFSTDMADMELIETVIRLPRGGERTTFVARNKNNGRFYFVYPDRDTGERIGYLKQLAQQIPEILTNEVRQVIFDGHMYNDVVFDTKGLEDPHQEDLRAKIDDVSNRITRLSQELDGLSGDHGLLFAKTESRELTQTQRLANLVFNALGVTLNDTSRLCLKKRLKELTYFETSEVFSLMFALINKIGDGSLKLNRNTEEEDKKKREKHETEYYLFEATNTEIDGVLIDSITIFVRPVDKVIDELGSVRQVAQARTNILIKSKSLPYGEVSIRIDPPDPRMANNIVFDLEVGKKGNQINRLETNAVAGHHFQSGIKIEDVGSVAEIHRAIASRLKELT